MAGHYINTVEDQVTGKPVNGAVIKVYQDGATIVGDAVTSGTLETIYSDDGVTTINQATSPLTTGADGEFDFYTNAPRVVIAVLVNGSGVAVWNDIDIPGSGLAGDITTLTARVDKHDTVLGLAASAVDLGTFTGTTIADNAAVKVALQSLETAVELRATLAQLAASSGSSLVGFIQSGTGAVQRSLQTEIREIRRTPKQFGAVGDNVADDRAAFVACDAVGEWELEPGSYKIASSVTLNSNVRIEPGAVIYIPTGVTVTFNGFFDAGVYQCFSCTGTGNVVFNWNKTWAGNAEWWGAKGDLSVDCSKAINAAIIALLRTYLQGGDYLCNSTILMQLDHRQLIGVGSKYGAGVHAETRLLIADGTQYGIVIGPNAFPGSINASQQNNYLENLYFGRLVAPVIANQAVGVQMQWTLLARMKNVKAAEHMTGFRFHGTITPKVDDCESVRSVVGTGAGTDFWRGFWIDGGASIGAAGGNASVYLNRCAAGCNVAALQTPTSQSAGFYIDQAFTDTFLDHPETVSCAIGIQVTGNNAIGNTFSNTDLIINHPIMDQFHNAGIFITTVAEAGSVEINSPYCGPATDARGSLWVNSSQAAVTITGGQLVHGGAPNVQPILISSSTGVTVNGTIILETGATHPCVGMSDAKNCRIMPTLKNRAVTGQAAVQLANNCFGNIIEPIVMGKASAFTFGVQVVGTLDDRNEYKMSGIDSGCINGGSANKLVRNGTQITATGLTGTNLASGVMT